MQKRVMIEVECDEDGLVEGIINTFDERYDGAHIVSIWNVKRVYE
jgi:hypothetical protein